MRLLAYTFVVYSFAVFFMACLEENVAGSGSQSGNAIHGVITDSTGQAVAKVTVTIIPKGYNALTDELKSDWTTQTNNEGHYHFENVDAGNYNIEAINPKDSTIVLVQNIEVNEEKPDVSIQNATLEAPGAITVPLNGLNASEGGYIYIPGTNIYLEIDSTSLTRGAITLSFVPAGEYQALQYLTTKPTEHSGQNLLTNHIEVKPSETSKIRGTYIEGIIQDENGAIPESIQVTLVPKGYLPWETNTNIRVFETITDQNGVYRFESIDSGTYSLESYNPETGHRALQTNLTISGDTLTLKTDTLHETGTLIVHLPTKVNEPGGFVHIPSTTIYTQVDLTSFEQGYVVLDPVPDAHLTSVRYVKSFDLVEETKFEIKKADTTILNKFIKWKHHRTAVIHTQNAVKLSGHLVHFPLLVRLNKNDFEFDEFQNAGADLLFTKPNGTILPHEIEFWSADEGKADVWVRIDTIHADRHFQELVMYWGNPSSATTNGKSEVFANNQFEGVWHLSEAAGNANNHFKDASGKLRHATGFNLAANSETLGVSGKTQLFDGENGYIILGDRAITNNSFYTISLWCKIKSGQTNMKVLSEAGSTQDSALFSIGQGYSDMHKADVFIRDDDHTDQLAHIKSLDTAFDDTWHLITWTDSLGAFSLYVDGERSVFGSYVKNLKRLNPTTLGGTLREQFTHAVEGTMDEVRFSSVIRSSDWIKLSFKTQKPGATIVEFR